MSDKKSLVLIDGEMVLSPLLREFLIPQDLRFTLIVNDTLDYSIPYNNEDPEDVIWIRQELVEVAKAIIKAGIRMEKETGQECVLPVRPDHGHQILDDIERDGYYPGYSLYGRIKNLAEIKGLTQGLLQCLSA